MNLLNLLTLLVGFVAVLISFSLLFKTIFLYRNKVLLLLAIISGPVWAFSIVAFFETQNIETALLYVKIIYTVSILTAIITFEFTRIFPYKDRFLFWQQFLILGLSVILFYQLWFTDNFVASINIINDAKTPIFGFYYTIWFLWFGSIIAWRIYILSKKLQSITEIAKKQTRYMITGISIAGLGIIPTNIVLPTFGIYEYIWVGPFMSAIMVSVIAYGVTTLRFFNLKNLLLYFTNIIIYAFLPSYTLGFLTYMFIYKNTNGDINPNIFWILTFLPMFSFITILKLKELILPKKVSLKEQLSKKIEKELTFKKIFENFEKLCVENLNLSGISFLLLDEKQTEVFKYTSPSIPMPSKIPILEFQSFNSYYKDNKKMILLQELRHLQLNSMEEQNIWKYKRFLSLINFLDKNNFHIVIPIKLREHMQSYIFLGAKTDKDIFNKNEIESLQELRSTIKVILERTVLYEEVESLNLNLQVKVDEQTKELKEKVLQLEKARKKEADMIDIMGHELRTPASIVKMNADFLEKFVKNNPKEFKISLDRIKNSIDNEIRLINTLLSSAKLEGDKIELQKEEIDIKAEIELLLHGYEIEASNKNLKLFNKVNKSTPNVFADKVRTIEILDNLVGNAIKYTHKGSVSVLTEFDDKFVKTSVIDTGKGIPTKDIPKLGQKFHRLDNYLVSNKKMDIVRPGGTGLGLYVTFKLAKLMGGDIWVESKQGKGTKFTFTLPVFKGTSIKKRGPESKNVFERLKLKRL